MGVGRYPLHITVSYIKTEYQYLVCAPLVAMHAWHLRLMLRTSLWIFAWVMLAHSSSIWRLRSAMVSPSTRRFETARPIWSQQCSMGLRSGLQAGHGSILAMFSFARKSRTMLARWGYSFLNRFVITRKAINDKLQLLSFFSPTPHTRFECFWTIYENCNYAFPSLSSPISRLVSCYLIHNGGWPLVQCILLLHPPLQYKWVW